MIGRTGGTCVLVKCGLAEWRRVDYARPVRVEVVDERDSSWENHEPRFRVYFWEPGDPGLTSYTYDLTEADIDDATEWAQKNAAGRQYGMALVVDDSVAARGLVWVRGRDANDQVQRPQSS
jgi:hypothetical protein